MKIVFALIVFTLLLLQGSTAQQMDVNQLKSQAENLYSQGSYARSHDVYAKINKAGLTSTEARWVNFRLADTQWRAEAATQTSDFTKFEEAQKQLEELIRVFDKETDRDLVWAEAHESLADYFWTRTNQMNWGAAWPHYQQSLDWWAGQRDLEMARKRYLAIVFKAAEPPGRNEYYSYSYYGNYIPLDVLENALKVSINQVEQSRLHYLIAITMRNQNSDWESRARVADEFEASLAMGRQSDWYDDALYAYADWMNGYGTIRPLGNGQWKQSPDYKKALELYRRIVTEFAKGETRYYDQAQQQIQIITTPVIGVATANIFLPNSEIQFGLNTRNVKRVDISIYKIDLTKDVRFSPVGDGDEGEGDGNWIQKVQVSDRRPVKTWTKDLADVGDYNPFNEQTRVEGKLPPGSYLIEARSGNLAARDLLLVTDVSLVLKSSPKTALAYMVNAISGAPVPNADVVLWESSYRDGKWHWRRFKSMTNSDGLAPIDLPKGDSSRNLFATAGVGDRQAFVSGYSNSYGSVEGTWRIYAFTDRPAYRPKETVQWKFIARRFLNSTYTTPSSKTLEYTITDPRGTKVVDGKATLNSFGSAWGSIELSDQLPLGEYNIQFWEDRRQNAIGSAQLFRLEEYKLPEFKVEVKTPEQDGKKKAFRLGDKVEVNIQADYYYGGAVANANVEVVVYQNPFFHYWFPRREYPWYYDDIGRPNRNYYGGGQVIKRETIKTDATGKATLTFDTPRENYNQDFEYRIEARVTDSSRREILANDSVRVTRQRYYVYPRAQKNIYRPKDKVTVDIKALDANEQPVSTEGTVKVTRDYWWEVWIDPNGREVKGQELQTIRDKGGVFPPVVPRGQKPWQLKFRGYQHDDVLTTNVKTDAEGVAQLNFTPERDGYYRVAWESSQGVDSKRDRFLPPVKAETSVFVATNASTELGYRQGGVEIVVDKDTMKAGETAPVMLSVPTSDRYVLFSAEADDLYSYKVIHITGTAKLIELPIEEKYIPNIYLSAVMVSDAQIFADSKQVVVPPVQQFLTVAVNADKEQYKPQEEGQLSISAKDAVGRPVSAEIALGLIDDSVSYIQQDYAGDPRQFYYGSKRQQNVQTQSTFNQKSYSRLVEDRNGQLRDDKQPALEKDEAAAFGKGAGARGDTTNFATDAISETVAVDKFQREEVKSLPLNGRQIANLAQLKPGVAAKADAAAPPPEQEPNVPVQVRSDFRSTILWLPDVKTDADGTASVKVKYPDSLTTWRATARVASETNQFGIGNVSTRTKQPLIVRLETPRFFVVGDQVTVSAVINNNTNEPMRVSSKLIAEGLNVTGLIVDGKVTKTDQSPVEVKANGESRVDWLVDVTHASPANLKVEARSANYADAMEKSFTVYEHGIEKFLSRSGKMRGDSVAVHLELPQARRAGSTSVTVQVAPSMATTMLDALPYLIDYPYGCTEQTMSRFLPAVITVKTLKDLGLKPETAMNKIFGGIDPATAAATHPNGKHDPAELAAITKQSLERLYDFQHSDGGWGWWKEGESDHFMTAYVVWGMTLAKQAGVDVKKEALSNGVEFLEKEIVEEETNYDYQAWLLHALAFYHSVEHRAEVEKFESTSFDNLWNHRDKLNAYTRALLALSAHYYGYGDKAMTLVQNLENGVKVDMQPDTSIVQRGVQNSNSAVLGTAHWGEDGFYWRWSDGGVEATSFVLRALLAIDPQNKLVEPVTNWLIKNRRGAQWNNTRDTAIVVLTMNDYLKVSKEVTQSIGYELTVNGSSIASKQLTAEDALGAPTKFVIPAELLKDGGNEISIKRTSGNGSLYFSTEAKFFSLEEPLTPAGNEIFVRRQYFKLVNHPTLLKGIISERVPLNDGETVKSGERVMVVLTVEAKNNYEYLLFEDLKPAGLEAVAVRSGEGLYARELKSGAVKTQGSQLMNFTSSSDFTDRSRWVYEELRDRKVALFIDHLPQGIWQISYEMRAEAPGSFHALPVLGQAMYVPEIRTNGGEVRIKVVD